MRAGRYQRSQRVGRTRPGAVPSEAVTTRSTTRSPASREPAEPRHEGDPIPMEVVRQPLAELEIALARRPVPPRRRDLGNRKAQLSGLDGQLERKLEAGRALDRHRVEEPSRVELEVVRRV